MAHSKAKYSRFINFYKIVNLAGDPPSHDQVFDAISKIEDSDRFHELVSRERMCVYDRSVDGEHRLLLATERTDKQHVFEKQADGKADLLKIFELKIGQRLAESTYAVFFEDGIVAIDFNQRGPKVADLERYLADKCKDHLGEHIRFRKLMARDVVEQIKDAKQITFFHVNLTQEHIPVLKKEDQPVGDAIDTLCKALGTTSLEFGAKPMYEASPETIQVFSKMARLFGEIVGTTPQSPKLGEKDQARKSKSNKVNGQFRAIDQNGAVNTLNLFKQVIQMRKVIEIGDAKDAEELASKIFEGIKVAKIRMQTQIDSTISYD